MSQISKIDTVEVAFRAIDKNSWGKRRIFHCFLHFHFTDPFLIMLAL
ncbi:MAG: hypothetical protein BWX44_00941 [Spirochaetes bacterium ADurb.Bin001]|nr:MAG: hypothetical protein BWX44_00941 [Spirochaetes bacterium ADurb.Bin001]